MNSYVNMGLGAFLGTVFVLMSVSIASEGIFHSGAPEKEGFAIVADEGGSEDSGAGAAEAVPVATLLANADPAAGETAFKKCVSCHTTENGGANKVGPNLWNIVNRPIASHEGFSYSAAMVTFSEGGKVVWDYEHLNGFLHSPKAHVPGTAMGFVGLKKDDERANVIAYLRTLSDNPVPLPTPSDEGADASGGNATTDDGAAPVAEEGAATNEDAAPAAEETAPTTNDEATTPDEAAPAEDAAPAEEGTSTEGTTTEQPAAE